MKNVVITGIGVLLPGCDQRDVFWDQLRTGSSQLSLEPDPSDPSVQCAIGRVHADPRQYLADIPSRFVERYPRELQLYLASLYLARADAKLNWGGLALDRVGLFDGVARPALSFWYDRIREQGDRPPLDVYSRRDLMVALPGQGVGLAASLLKVRGPTYTFTSTCSSGAVAIGHAMREIQHGDLDVALATGHESSLIAPLFAMYREAGLISAEQADPSRALGPYTRHTTNAFGEGAVTLVLEERSHAERRGATILASLAGYSYGNNGMHPTSIDILGVRPTEVLERLFDEHNPLDDVSFVVGHGNGVRRSDVSEENYMRRLFGARAAEVPLLSVKPIYGHNLGASSAMSTAAAVMMLHNDYVIPTINIDEQRLRRVTNHPTSGMARPCKLGVAMSYGMGGQNAAVLVKKYDPAAEMRRCA